MASTFAGNFTILGSVANLIVVERARRHAVTIGFWAYFRIGAPLTSRRWRSAYGCCDDAEMKRPPALLRGEPEGADGGSGRGEDVAFDHPQMGGMEHGVAQLLDRAHLDLADALARDGVAMLTAPRASRARP